MPYLHCLKDVAVQVHFSFLEHLIVSANKASHIQSSVECH